MLLLPRRIRLKSAVFAVSVALFCTAVQAQSTSPTAETATAGPTASAPTPNSTPALPDSKTLEVVKSVRAAYPYEAAEKQMQGQVRLKLLVDEAGDVADAQVIEGDDIFKQSAIDAAKKWKFKPFIRNGKPIKVATVINMDFAVSGNAKDVEQPLGANLQAPPDSGKSSNPGNIVKRVRISQGVSEGLLVHKVQPTYPPEARANHVQGHVVLRALIGKDGEIHDLEVISGPPELVQSAMGAVRQWRYRPYYLKGEPVEVDTLITVNYVLHSF